MLADESSRTREHDGDHHEHELCSYVNCLHRRKHLFLTLLNNLHSE